MKVKNKNNSMHKNSNKANTKLEVRKIIKQ